MQLPEEPEQPFSINILPAIDVIFVILAFVILSTLYLTRSEVLPVNLPEAGTAQTQQTKTIDVTVTKERTVAINRQPVNLEQIQTELSKLVEPGVESLVLVNADEKAYHGDVVAVMDRIRQVEGVKLAIAVKQVNNQ
ncbi:MAG: biopolymer transporter ExbD [Spirulinaceae cyanobacterium]